LEAGRISSDCKDFSLELEDQFVGLVRHAIRISTDMVASIDNDHEHEVAA
jgi:hypothetical protein